MVFKVVENNLFTIDKLRNQSEEIKCNNWITINVFGLKSDPDFPWTLGCNLSIFTRELSSPMSYKMKTEIEKDNSGATQ